MDVFILTHFESNTEITEIVGVFESDNDAEVAKKRTGWTSGFRVIQCTLGQVMHWKRFDDELYR